MTTKSAKTLRAADDEPTFRTFVRRVAELDGYDVVECGSGKELVGAYRQDPRPGRVLLDLLMPETDGIETLRLLAAEDALLEICLITGGSEINAMAARHIAEDGSLKITDVLSKPLPLDRLRAAIA